MTTHIDPLPATALFDLVDTSCRIIVLLDEHLIPVFFMFHRPFCLAKSLQYFAIINIADPHENSLSKP